jgi:hypothetical protein
VGEKRTQQPQAHSHSHSARASDQPVCHPQSLVDPLAAPSVIPSRCRCDRRRVGCPSEATERPTPSTEYFFCFGLSSSVTPHTERHGGCEQLREASRRACPPDLRLLARCRPPPAMRRLPLGSRPCQYSLVEQCCSHRLPNLPQCTPGPAPPVGRGCWTRRCGGR